MTDYDVVILGSGLAGTCAALEAAGLGARVLIAEAEERPGGRSQFSTGMIMGAGTRFQRDKGIEDSPENLFRHYMTLNQWKVDASIVHRLAEQAGPPSSGWPSWAWRSSTCTTPETRTCRAGT